MYEPLDEDERRQRRDDSPYNSGGTSTAGLPGWDPRSWNDGYGDPQDGLGSPESGYGPRGVENPAYTQPTQTVQRAGTPDVIAPPPRPMPTPPPAPTPQPTFQPAAPAPQAAAPAAQQPAITDEVTKLLMARLNELKNPGDVENDPIYQQSVRAYQIGQLRSAEKQRKSLAERAAAGGTRSSGGFNVGVLGINERAGENAAQYRSGLALDRLRSREQQLVEAIKMARAVGQDDIANQLEVQRLSLQQELGRGDLQLRSGLGYGNLGLGYADLIQRANRDAVLAALGGA